MQTSQKSIFDIIEETSTSSPEGSHASHTARPGLDAERKMTATFGLKCLDAFGRFPRVGSWAKTFSALLIGMEGWSSTKCRLIWKLKGTRFNRMYFQLLPSTLPTEGTGFGLLPTEMLPTPTASECRDTQLTAEQAKKLDKGGRVLRRLGTLGMLPTPTTRDWKGKQANEYKQDRGEETEFKMQSLCGVAEKMAEPTSKPSQLNPQFVGEMMGFPENWTASPFQSGEMNQSKPTGTQ